MFLVWWSVSWVVNDNVCKTKEKQAVPPRTGCDCPVLLYFSQWTWLDLITAQEQHLAELAALSTSACSLLAGSLACQPRTDQSCGMSYHSAKSESVHAHRFTGEKETVAHLPVCDLCSQCRAGVKLFHLPSSPISTTVCHLSRNTEQKAGTKNPQRLGAHTRVANRAKPGLLLLSRCCYLG